MIKKLAMWYLLKCVERKAIRLYNGPGEAGELFNTCTFQHTYRFVFGCDISSRDAQTKLILRGWKQLYGGHHWGKENNETN